MSTLERTEILNAEKVNQKITRIAHQIHERHYKSKSLVLVGISGNGEALAERLAKLLSSISSLEISFIKLEINKEHPQKEVTFSEDASQLKNIAVIVVDDVINSGRTLIYAVKYVLDSNPRSVGTVALIDRIHRRFPLGADYVGMRLSTTLKEHVTVVLTPNKEQVYLE